MKKFMIVCVLVISGMLVGCDLTCKNAPDIANNWVWRSRNPATKEIIHNVHEYIIIRCDSGYNIIHSKSCRCRK